MQVYSSAAGRLYARVVYPPESASEDGELARRIATAGAQRDAAAEAELCRRFAPRVRLYGLRHLRSEAAAADLVQDVLILTLQKLRAGEVRELEKLASFILGTCRQTVIDGRRGGIRRERILEAFAPTLDVAVEDSDAAPDTARLEHCLQHLPERERSVLVMTFYDDRPADEVGVALGLSAGNVRVIRHRGIERLRRCVEEQAS
ncbi:MAG TPA: sigma-70 family RNA polymerase sigma factor [Steroidobacteraceae bacterium]|jgi:RNA polymerase sigma-70 factor (ECF subfamily)|nr:sigma-70 family RNA polymerase sigma factor [Steroidobacteraceae bacterium]